MLKAITVVALLGLAAAEQDKKITSCKSETDCTDSSFPFCALTYVDTTKSDAAPVYKGVCVQCRDDCDCGVNQYCATNAILGKSSFPMSDKDLAKNDEWFAVGLAGLTFPSVCRSYGQSDSEKANAGLGKNGASALGAPCKTAAEDGLNVHTNAYNKGDCEFKIQTGWTKDDFRNADRGTGKCGALASQYAVDGYSAGWIGGSDGNTPRVAAEGKISETKVFQPCDYQKKVALQMPAVDNKGETVKEMASKSAGAGGGSAIVITLDKLKAGNKGGSLDFVNVTEATPSSFGDIVVKAYDWEGVCFNGKCNVCAEGDKRCTVNDEVTGGRGTPQICLGGNWVAYVGGTAKGQAWSGVDNSIVNGVATAGLLSTLTALVAFFFFIMCCCGCISLYKKKKAAEANGEKPSMKMFFVTSPPPGKV